LQDEQGKLLPREQRKKQIEALGLTESSRPVVAYCGSGIASAWLAAALQDLEIDAALYVGSWSAWSAREA
jgi:thiosulfate/3-mercaptopyruvate sulfurtransferase